MEDEYVKTVRKFNEIYAPLRKKYNLRLHSHFSIYKDGLIEIWKYRGEAREKLIVRVSEPEDIDCYNRAIEELESFQKQKEREESGHGRNTAMAV